MVPVWTLLHVMAMVGVPAKLQVGSISTGPFYFISSNSIAV